MSISQPGRRYRRRIRTLVACTAGIVLLILGLHIWFVHNARKLIINMVATKSEGRLKLELSQVRFDFLSNKLQVREADLVSTDSATAITTYHIRFRKLTLKTGSFWSLIFQNKLNLDSIKLHDPEIVVTQWRKDTAHRQPSDLSVPQQMGKLYNSMLDGLDAFGIRRVAINNAKLTLRNMIDTTRKPTTISNINFSLVRTAEGIRDRDEFISGKQSVDLTTTRQDIQLPGGRHRLAFKNFRLQLFNKRIEMDSCTLTAAAQGNVRSSYTIFFHKLLLVGVDFEAMYRQNLIKADSVYCADPSFDISLVTGSSDTVKKEKPDPGKIINELTGDLDLAFVGVKDAGIRINITGRTKRSLTNSHKDDFEMRGLRIHSDSAKPVVVDRFDMLVRDYHLYNEDSSTAYAFDSIHFMNNKIVLNNFSVRTSSDNKRIRDERDFRIPYFQLTGLDWYQLIFEENLQAREAVLHNPVISYTKRIFKKGPKKKTNIFKSMQTLDDLITLNKVTVINGQINMQLAKDVSLRLHDANLSLFSDRLLESTNNEGLRRAVEQFSIARSLIKFKDITATITGARYTGKDLVQADHVSVRSRDNRISAGLRGVRIHNLLVDESSETMQLDGLSWQQADIAIRQAAPRGKKASKGGDLHLQHLAGSNTKFSFSNGKMTASSFVRSLALSSFTRMRNGQMTLEGLLVDGNELNVNGPGMKLRSATYRISGDGASHLSDMTLNQVKGLDTLSFTAPRLDFSADINAILAKDMHLNSVEARGAVVRMAKHNPPASGAPAKSALRIDRIAIYEPDIHFSTHRDDSVTSFSLPKRDNSKLLVTRLQTGPDGIRMGSVDLQTESLVLTKKTGEIVGVEKGKVDLQVSDVHIANKDGKPAWSVLVNSLHLRNPRTFALGKKGNKLHFDETSLGNLRLSSDYTGNFSKLIKFNISAWLRTTTGSYIDSAVTLQWHNAAYHSNARVLSLDSLVYHPTLSRDSAIASNPVQMDYITLHTGSVQLKGFDLEKYERDSSIIAETMEINKPVITIFRDKKPPFGGGKEKPLPVDMIRQIAMPLSIDRLLLTNGLLSYSERHAKTRAEGTLHLTRLNAELSNIRNFGLGVKDSLGLSLSAYLMDSALIRLMVKESYTDSLSSFVMTLKLKPTSLSFLNPVLVPLSNVMITSGTIDSFQLRAIGNKGLSIGEMNMYYHDLRIKLVKDGEETKQGVMARMATFLANALVIKKNNDGRTGLVYFERLKDRSFFNYIVKMTFSGMATSIGVIKNKKYMKKYEKELKQQHLPPINF